MRTQGTTYCANQAGDRHVSLHPVTAARDLAGPRRSPSGRPPRPVRRPPPRASCTRPCSQGTSRAPSPSPARPSPWGRRGASQARWRWRRGARSRRRSGRGGRRRRGQRGRCCRAWTGRRGACSWRRGGSAPLGGRAFGVGKAMGVVESQCVWVRRGDVLLGGEAPGLEALVALGPADEGRLVKARAGRRVPESTSTRSAPDSHPSDSRRLRELTCARTTTGSRSARAGRSPRATRAGRASGASADHGDGSVSDAWPTLSVPALSRRGMLTKRFVRR